MLIVVLGLISIFPPLATDMYLPAMLDMQMYFNAPTGGMGLSLSLFFLGLCVGQIIFGPLVDAFGRKKPLLFGILVYILTSFACLLTHDFGFLIMLRFFQALGACSGMIIGRAIISDLFEGVEAAKVMSLIVVIMTLGPICSPITGSLFLELWSWKSIFYVMALIGVLACFMVFFFIPESLPAHKRIHHSIWIIAKDYGGLLINREFLLFSLICSFVQAGMFAFITGSSNVFMGQYHLSSVQYGFCFGFVTLGLVFFAYVNAKIISRVGLVRLIHWAFLLNFLSGISLLSLSGINHLWALLIPLWFCIASTGALGANTITLAMQACSGRLGIGSALIGFIQFGFAFLVSGIVSATQNDSVYPMVLGIVLPGFVALLLWLFSYRKIRNTEG